MRERSSSSAFTSARPEGGARLMVSWREMVLVGGGGRVLVEVEASAGGEGRAVLVLLGDSAASAPLPRALRVALGVKVGVRAGGVAVVVVGGGGGEKRLVGRKGAARLAWRELLRSSVRLLRRELRSSCPLVMELRRGVCAVEAGGVSTLEGRVGFLGLDGRVAVPRASLTKETPRGGVGASCTPGGAAGAPEVLGEGSGGRSSCDGGVIRCRWSVRVYSTGGGSRSLTECDGEG